MAEPAWQFLRYDGEWVLVVTSAHRATKQGSGCWVARIKGGHPKFGLDREFLGESHVTDEGFTQVGVPLTALRPLIYPEPGSETQADILEIFGGGMWKWQRRGFYQVFCNDVGPTLLGLERKIVFEILGVPYQPELTEEEAPAEKPPARPSRKFRLERE